MVGVAQSGGQKHGQLGTLQRPTRKQKVRQGRGGVKWGAARIMSPLGLHP